MNAARTKEELFGTEASKSGESSRVDAEDVSELGIRVVVVNEALVSPRCWFRGTIA